MTNWYALFRRPAPKQTPRARRLKRALLALGLYTVGGFLVLPLLIKWQLVKQLPEFTHRQATVQQVRVNPFALSLTIRGLSLTETNGEAFAGFDEFYANFQLSSLFRWTWIFREVSLNRPALTVVRGADGEFNFANLLTNRTDTAPSTHLPRVLVENLAITNGVVTFTDHTHAAPFRAGYAPLDIRLSQFTTVRDQDGPYAIVATTGDGERFEWSGTVSVNPLLSAGEVRLAGIPLKKYAPYLAPFTTARIADGTLEVAATYRFNAAAVPLQLEVTNAAVDLRALKVNAPNGETVVTLNRLRVTNATASLAGQEMRVPLLRVDGGTSLVRRDADGQFNGLNFLVTRTLVEAALATNSPARTWSVFVDEVDVAGFSITAEDHTPPQPAQLGLDDVHLRVKGFSNQTNAPLSLTLAFKGRAGGAGEISVSGTLLPPGAEARVNVTNLPIAPFQPYAEQFTHLVVHSGTVTSEGKIRFQPEAATTNGAVLHLESDTTVTGLRVRETLSHQELVRFESHSVRGVAVDLGRGFRPQRVSIEEIQFTGLNAGVTVTTNGLINVLALVKAPAKDDAPHAETGPTDSFTKFPIRIGSLVLEKSSLHAMDQSIKPRFNTTIEELNGSVRNLTWPDLGRIAVDLRGKVSALAPFEVTGTVTPDLKPPFADFVDLKIGFKNSDLTPFTPYAEKFLGYPINKGKLTFDVACHIENRALKAENIVAIDQFTLGARTPSTNATKLPVKLGVALLKDRNGRIDLNLPVTGSLDDPKFSLGKVVMQVFVNVLVKVATSPFALLGAAFGGGEELQYVEFAPGSAVLADAQTNKLEKLSKALFERPALNLEIGGSVEANADRAVLTRQKLRNAMKSMRLEELAARHQPVPALAELILTDDNYDQLLRKAYKDMFDTTPERALREARAAAAATNTTGDMASAPAVRRTAETQKGAMQLNQAAIEKKTAPAPGADATTPSKPKTADELVREELEQRLSETTQATDDDLRDLMQQRAQAVQKFLLETGKVTAERLFLMVPKPVDPSAKGEARANFSLN